MDYSPPPKPPMIQQRQKSSLMDVLGSGMNEKLKLKNIMNKHMGYEKPKAPGKKVYSSHPDYIDL